MNQLQHETSPYLLQHAHNPVDWYAWKPEAFERARLENKPVLVSIGYSTCHWCHVMERESFENPDIASLMNSHFINIKVDREERPDVDAIYMEACQIMTGSGGWPLNCFLTPEGKPFFAGTYYPPRPAHNRPSWLQVLQHLSNVWETKRETVYEQADKLMDYIRRNDAVFLKKIDPEIPANAQSPFTPGLMENIYYQMREQFDRVEGGFGGAPKFPSTLAIQYLLNYYWFTQQGEALEHALLSLDKMIMGGIYDQLGGGFSRYSTDREWLAPHFEKMLYDNALLITVLAEAVKLLQHPGLSVDHKEERLLTYQETIEETLRYVDREMTHPLGGFYAAQDADSEGVEGKFFVWDKATVDTLLGADAPIFCSYYDVTEQGNWEHTNILHRTERLGVFAAAQKQERITLKKQLDQQREILFRERAKRVHPGLDDKILLGWNALMCSAYVHAYTALGHESYREAAVRNMEFMLENMVEGPEQRLHHTWKNAQLKYAAVLDDYAFLLIALLDIWQITFNFKYLTLAEKYTEQVLSYFHDTESGLFFYTASDQTDIILRKKDLYDNATPSGNSTMVQVLQRLGLLADRPEWLELAAQMLEKMVQTVERYPLSFERWANSMLYVVHPYIEIAVVGENAFDKVQAIQRRFMPNKVLAASVTEQDQNPLLAGKPGNADAFIYVCRNYACLKPVQTLEAMDALIQTEI